MPLLFPWRVCLMSALVFAIFSALPVHSAPAPAVKYLGEWSSTLKYKPGQIVSHQGATWISLTKSLGSEPGQSIADWALLGVAQQSGVSVVDANDKKVGAYLGKDAQGLGQVAIVFSDGMAQAAFDSGGIYAGKGLYFPEENCAGSPFELIIADSPKDSGYKFPSNGIDLPLAIHGTLRTAYVPDGTWIDAAEITYRSKNQSNTEDAASSAATCVNETVTVKSGGSLTPLPAGGIDPNGCTYGKTCWHPALAHCMSVDLCSSAQYEGQCQCYPDQAYEYLWGVRHYKSMGNLSTLHPPPYRLQPK